VYEIHPTIFAAPRPCSVIGKHCSVGLPKTAAGTLAVEEHLQADISTAQESEEMRLAVAFEVSEAVRKTCCHNPRNTPSCMSQDGSSSMVIRAS
jgi:hypothetical protein